MREWRSFKFNKRICSFKSKQVLRKQYMRLRWNSNRICKVRKQALKIWWKKFKGKEYHVCTSYKNRFKDKEIKFRVNLTEKNKSFNRDWIIVDFSIKDTILIC